MQSDARDPIQPSISAEEEVVKRNTDCVYFLASPLTCKNGNECEYRHSEGARVNPRDCWFWLNGNCLNAKCSFRHPPLDGLLESPMATAAGSALPLAQTAMPTQVPAAYGSFTHTSNKQSTPCYFFQKGGCLKGDKCPFMHGVLPVSSSIPQQAGKVATPPIEPSSTSKNPSWSLEKCMQQNKPELSTNKPVEDPHSLAKPNAKTEIAPTSGLTTKSSLLPTPLVNEKDQRFQPNTVALAKETAQRFQPDTVAYSVCNSKGELQGCHMQPVEERLQNGREADDSLRESSPGFDVLVDDEHEDTDYFHKDDEFGGANYSEKNPNLVNDFDYCHSDYDSVTKFEKEAYNGIADYDHHGQRDWYHREHRRSSERNLKRPSIPERRGPWKESSPDKLDASDLRHRLLKQRRLNGPRSAGGADHHGDPYHQDDQFIEEQRYQSRNSHRDHRNHPPEGSLSNRLQGRITLPGRPSSDDYGNLQSEGVIEMGRNWGRSSSPGLPLNTQGRHHDTIKQKAHKDVTTEARNLGGQPRRRDEIESLNFAGPKSLAELKGAKFSVKSEVTLNKIDNCTIISEQHKLEDSLSFEGPKPLSVILKRKREVVTENDAVLSNGLEDNQRAIEEHASDLTTAAITDNKIIHPLESENGERHTFGNIEVPEATAVAEAEEEEGLIVSDGEELSSLKREVLDVGDDKLEGNMEDDKLEGNMEEPEAEHTQRNAESNYEATGMMGFKMEDAEGIPHPDQSLHKGEMLKTEDGILVDDEENPESQNYGMRNDGDEEFEHDTTECTNFKTEDGEYTYEEGEDLDDEDGDDFARKLGLMLS